MNGLVELIFEEVPDVAVNSLVSDLLNGAAITEISHSELGRCESNSVENNYFKFLKLTEDATSIIVKTKEISIGGVIINRPLVRMLRYHNLNEVAVIFDSLDVAKNNQRTAILNMAAGTKVLAKRSGVREFYCGFEPASDQSTRLFSGEKIGPITVL
jgi:hypothetical protein